MNVKQTIEQIGTEKYYALIINGEVVADGRYGYLDEYNNRLVLGVSVQNQGDEECEIVNLIL